MTAKPIKFKVKHDEKAQALCIETLRRQLERAERGEILGVAIATVDVESRCSYDHAGTSGFRLVGAMEMLKASIIADLMES